MTLDQITAALESIAPTHLAESWDNVGLLVGDPKQNITSILLTIDYTSEVAAEAEAKGCNLVVAYHPPIFSPLKRVVSPSPIFAAIKNGVAIYSPHTALDIAEGGTNDMLADAVGMLDRLPLRPSPPKATQYKLVTFVPESAVGVVSQAIFQAGAGWIGKYSSCSFRAPGIGTFFGQPGSNPSVGESGHVEHAPEIRLETLVPIAKGDAVVEALLKSHPYEEPAYDLVVLAPTQSVGKKLTHLGMGRIGSVKPTARSEIVNRIKRELELDHVLVAGPAEGDVERVAVCAGACGDLLDDAIAGGAQLYLTGEMRHHDAIKAAKAGLTVVCTLHSNSERAVLKRLKNRLDQTPGMVPIHIASADRDPFSVR